MWPLLGREIRAVLGGEGGDAADDDAFTGIAVRDDYGDGDVLFAIDLNGLDGHAYVDAYLHHGGRLAIVSSHAAARCVRVDDVYSAFKTLARWMRERFTFPVIAVAGANGKTTTKDMICAVLGPRASATTGTENGHYGVPLTLLDRAHNRDKPPSALVIEIGIDAVGAMREHAELVRPDFVVVTSLGEEHLRGLRDEETAAHEELALITSQPEARRIFDDSDARLCALARPSDVLVSEYRVGPFDGTSRELSIAMGGSAPQAPEHSLRSLESLPRAPRFSIAMGGSAPQAPEHSLRSLESLRRAPRFSIGDVKVQVPLPGEHHARLAALAVATGLALGRRRPEIEAGFAKFRPPPGRAEIIKLDRELVVVDDSFNASPGSMRAAIELANAPCWAARPKALLLGDMLDLGDATVAAHVALVPLLRELRGAHVRLFGDAMGAVYRALVTDGSELGSVAHAASNADPFTLLDSVWGSLEGALVIVKGSRGMRLERVTHALRRVYERPRPLPARPSIGDDFLTVGVTGTNGKTSTTTWIAAMLAREHAHVARATTLGYFLDDERMEHSFDFDGFVAALGEAHTHGARACALEVTSEALHHGFAKIWPFRVGVFTNLTHDHLDVHTTPEHYLASKAQLFMNLAPGGVAVLNACDPASALLREVLPGGVTVLQYGVASRGALDGEADLLARSVRVSGRRTHVTLERSTRLERFPAEITLPVIGDVFVENALAAALGAWAAGISVASIVSTLAEAKLPDGRFEIIAERPWVVIDYAHTPDALARTIVAGRTLGPGRITVVFGAGGDRDTRKRVPMGRAAALADVVYVTNDNPRTEDPETIARDLASGVGAHPHLTIELDRARAIKRAITDAAPDDVVLICGKGHETHQTIGSTRHPFSDREVALSACTASSS